MKYRVGYRVLPLLVCLAACVAIDLAYFPRQTVFPDEQRILGSAAHLVATGNFSVGGDRAWEMPGPAIFFAPAVWLFGAQGAIIPLRLAQALLVVIQCGLAGTIARRLFGSARTGLIASWVTALYPFLLFYQGLLLSETLFNTFLLAGLAVLFWWRDRGFRIDLTLFVAVLCFAVATMTKATLTILPPLLIAATAFFGRAGLRRTLHILLTASCLYAGLMSVWWVRNAVVLHAFVPFATGSAMNFYLGNNPKNTDAGIAWDRDVEPAVVARISAIHSEIERERAFSQAAINYIIERPDLFILRATQKFLRLWNIIPNASEFRTNFYSFVSAASFGPVLALALASAIRWRRRWRDFAPLYLVVGYLTFVHVVTIASLRYRLPMEPLLIVMAAGPLGAFFRPAGPCGPNKEVILNKQQRRPLSTPSNISLLKNTIQQRGRPIPHTHRYPQPRR